MLKAQPARFRVLGLGFRVSKLGVLLKGDLGVQMGYLGPI